MASPVSPIPDPVKLRREEGRRFFHGIGIVQMALGGVAIILGIVTLVYGIPNGSFFSYVGTPLWTGLLLLVCGFLGIKAGAERDGPGDVVTSAQKNYIVGYCIITIVTVTPAIFIVTGSAIVYNQCLISRVTNLDCAHFVLENVTIALIDIIVAGIIIILCALPPVVFFFLYARAFGLRVSNMSTDSEADPILTEPVHCKADIIHQQQEEIQRLADRLDTMEKQLSSVYTVITTSGVSRAPLPEPLQK